MDFQRYYWFVTNYHHLQGVSHNNIYFTKYKKYFSYFKTYPHHAFVFWIRGTFPEGPWGWKTKIKWQHGFVLNKDQWPYWFVKQNRDISTRSMNLSQDKSMLSFHPCLSSPRNLWKCPFSKIMAWCPTHKFVTHRVTLPMQTHS